jgi:hypothetical protein
MHFLRITHEHISASHSLCSLKLNLIFSVSVFWVVSPEGGSDMSLRNVGNQLRRHISEDHNKHLHHCRNVKSDEVNTVWNIQIRMLFKSEWCAEGFCFCITVVEAVHVVPVISWVSPIML